MKIKRNKDHNRPSRKQAKEEFKTMEAARIKFEADKARRAIPSNQEEPEMGCNNPRCEDGRILNEDGTMEDYCDCMQGCRAQEHDFDQELKEVEAQERKYERTGSWI